RMPAVGTCCLVRTIRQNFRPHLIQHGIRQFPIPFCLMPTGKFSTRAWAVWTSLNCAGRFWRTSHQITPALTNTGSPLPPRATGEDDRILFCGTGGKRVTAVQGGGLVRAENLNNAHDVCRSSISTALRCAAKLCRDRAE